MTDFDIVPVKATLVDTGPLAALVARVLPHSWVAVRRAKDSIDETILAKLKAGEPLDQADVEYAEQHLGPDVAKYIRTRRIVQRGAVALPKLLAASSDGSTKPAQSETSSDFVNKFREDASLVDDEVLQEVYGRVLAQEAQAPGSVALGTLRVLRYLDRDVADTFSIILQLVFLGQYVAGDSALRRSLGIDHAKWLSLSDAGLVSPTTSSLTPELGTRLPFFFKTLGHTFTVEKRKEDEKFHTTNFDINLLTRAGADLARIAEGPAGPETVSGLARWFKEAEGTCTLGSYEGSPTAPKSAWKAL